MDPGIFFSSENLFKDGALSVNPSVDPAPRRHGEDTAPYQAHVRRPTPSPPLASAKPFGAAGSGERAGVRGRHSLALIGGEGRREGAAGVRGFLTLFLILLSTPLFAAPQLAWEQRYNFGLPTRTNQVITMTLDNAGDIIIAGSQANASGDLDYAILKYSQTGTQLWARTYSSGPQSNDRLRAMAVDNNGNVYVTGTSTTVKYNSEGLLQWVAPYSGRALTANSNEFVYVVGFQTNDFATVKLAPQGTNVWLRTYDRPFGSDIAQAVALGPAGEVYVGGTVTWAYDHAAEYLKFALVKYDAAGNQHWVSPDFDTGGGLHVSTQSAESEVRRIIVLGSDRVYLAGNFWGGAGGHT